MLAVLISPIIAVTLGYLVRQARQPDLYEPIHHLGELASRFMPVGHNFVWFTSFQRFAAVDPIRLTPQATDPWPQLIAASPLCYLNAIPMIRVPDLIIASGVIIAFHRTRSIPKPKRRRVQCALVLLGATIISMALLAASRVLWTGAAEAKRRAVEQRALDAGVNPYLGDFLGDGGLCYLMLALAAAVSIVWLVGMWAERVRVSSNTTHDAQTDGRSIPRASLRHRALPFLIAALWLSPWLVTWTIAPIIALGFRYLA